VRSLTWKLTLFVIGVSLLSITIVFLLARWITVREFDRLVIAQTRSDVIARARTHYQQVGSWQGVIDVMPRPGREGAPPPPPGQTPPRPFAILDQQGCVVLPAGRFDLGDCNPSMGPEEREPLVLDDQPIGTLITVNTNPGLNRVEAAYLMRTNRAILWSAVGATLLAVMVGLVTARTLVRPLQRLTTAIHAMTAGDLHQEVPIQSQDEIGELARAFNQMSADLARANQARRQMTADIAHDLRNPLMVMIGYLEAMRDGVLEPTPKRLATLYDEAHHLQHLVNDLRTLSLADAGELTLQREVISPTDLLLRAYRAWLSQARQRDIALLCRAPEGLPAVSVDAERINQVLNNLISNALRYTPPDGRIVLAAQQQGDQIVLTVQDNGTGIAADHLPFIFDRFYRADPARTETGGESGLGLAIARSIVETHGGTLRVTSLGVGQGTTFSLHLPLLTES
jgi:signal transduction histidine kinase